MFCRNALKSMFFDNLNNFKFNFNQQSQVFNSTNSNNNLFSFNSQNTSTNRSDTYNVFLYGMQKTNIESSNNDFFGNSQRNNVFKIDTNNLYTSNYNCNNNVQKSTSYNLVDYIMSYSKQKMNQYYQSNYSYNYSKPSTSSSSSSSASSSSSSSTSGSSSSSSSNSSQSYFEGRKSLVDPKLLAELTSEYNDKMNNYILEYVYDLDLNGQHRTISEYFTYTSLIDDQQHFAGRYRVVLPNGKIAVASANEIPQGASNTANYVVMPELADYKVFQQALQDGSISIQKNDANKWKTVSLDDLVIKERLYTEDDAAAQAEYESKVSEAAREAELANLLKSVEGKPEAEITAKYVEKMNNRILAISYDKRINGSWQFASEILTYDSLNNIQDSMGQCRVVLANGKIAVPSENDIPKGTTNRANYVVMPELKDTDFFQKAFREGSISIQRYSTESNQWVALSQEIIRERLYTEDDAAAQAEYETELARLNSNQSNTKDYSTRENADGTTSIIPPEFATVEELAAYIQTNYKVDGTKFAGYEIKNNNLSLFYTLKSGNEYKIETVFDLKGNYICSKTIRTMSNQPLVEWVTTAFGEHDAEGHTLANKRGKMEEKAVFYPQNGEPIEIVAPENGGIGTSYSYENGKEKLVGIFVDDGNRHIIAEYDLYGRRI